MLSAWNYVGSSSADDYFSHVDTHAFSLHQFQYNGSFLFFRKWSDRLRRRSLSWNRRIHRTHQKRAETGRSCMTAVQVGEHLAWHQRHKGYNEEKKRLAKAWRDQRRHKQRAVSRGQTKHLALGVRGQGGGGFSDRRLSDPVAAFVWRRLLP